MLSLTLLDELLITLFKLVALPAQLNRLALRSLLILSQCLKVEEHRLIVLSELLDLLLFDGHVMLERANFFILLLNDH